MHKLKNLFVKHGHMNWALLDQAMISGVNFATGLLLARFLGIEEFGYFTLVWMVVLFSNSIQMALISAPMMSIGPKQEEKEKATYYGAVIVKQAYFSLIVFVLICLGGYIAHYVSPGIGIGALIFPLACVTVAFQAQDFVRRMLFSQDKPMQAFLNDAISYMGQIAVLMYLFITLTVDTIHVLWVITSMSMIAVVVAIFFTKNVEINDYMPTKIIKRHWVSSKWLLSAALLQWLSGNFFFILAGTFLGTAAVGAIKASQNLLAILNIGFQGLENVVPAHASLRFHSDGSVGMWAYIRKVIILGSFVTAIFAILMAVSAEFWLGFVFGEAYIAYTYVVQCWAIIFILMFIGFPLRAGFRAMERTKPIFISYVVAAIFTVACGWFLTKQFGIIGVMFGLLINYSIMIVFLGFSSKNKSKI